MLRGMSKLGASRGVSALPVVLIMASIILEVTVAGLVVSTLLSGDLKATQASTKAIEIAKSGAQDAIARVTKYCSDGSVGVAAECPATYILNFGDDQACVNLKGEAQGDMIIYVKGKVSRRERYVKAVLSVASTGANEGSVRTKSIEEVEDPGVDLAQTCRDL